MTSPSPGSSEMYGLQSSAVFDTMGFWLFRAFFSHSMHIRKPKKRFALAWRVPIDQERCVTDFTSEVARYAVLDEYEEALNQYMVYAPPTMVPHDSECLGSAVSMKDHLTIFATFGIS